MLSPINTLDELKQIELNILKKVHTFCENNNIRYVLGCGTLLGAVRHNGFIPWDDDIDILMTRNEYERFIEIFPKWGKENNLEIRGIHTAENVYPRDMLKVCDTRTLLIEKDYKSQCKLGVFIDIWPLDKIPERLSLFDKLWLKEIRLLKQIITACDLSIKSYSFKQFPLYKKLFVILFGNFNIRKVCLIKESLAKKNRHLDKYNYTTSVERYSRKDLFPPVLHQFEDALFYIPNNFDEVLKEQYNDYMTLPPPEKRQPHHIQDVYWKE